MWIQSVQTVSTKMCGVIESFVKNGRSESLTIRKYGFELIFFSVFCLFSCPISVKVKYYNKLIKRLFGFYMSLLSALLTRNHHTFLCIKTVQ